MNEKDIEFWYEFASTYSYLSACRIEELTQKSNLRIKWKPFLLGPIFKQQGWDTSPFIIYPAKGKYMWQDIERQCKKYNLSFKKPSQFPRSGLLAARVAFAASNEDLCPEFSKKIFYANFVEDKNIADQDIVKEIVESIGKDSFEIISKAQSDENKKLLRKQNEEAVIKGIFGAPSFIVNNELFWGNDRLEDAISYSTNSL